MLCCLIVITLSSLAVYCPLYLIEIIIKCLEKDDKKKWVVCIAAAAGPWMSVPPSSGGGGAIPAQFSDYILSPSRLLSLRCSLSNALRMLLRIMIMMKRSSSILMRSHWTPRIVCTFPTGGEYRTCLSLYIHYAISQQYIAM